MTKQSKLTIIGLLLLLGATIAWGTSFYILKETISALPPIYVIGVRFLVASILFFLLFLKRFLRIKKITVRRGLMLGFVLFFAYLFQTEGLIFTTPSKNAFITSLYCVMTPFIVWIFYKQRPKAYNIISAVMCVVGIDLIVLSGKQESASNEFLGNALTFIAAIFYAFQLLLNDKFITKEKEHPIEILTVELFSSGILLLVFSLVFELPKMGINSYKLNADQMLKIGYLTIACTSFAQLAQIIGQKYTTANQSAIVLSLEAVFGALFSVILGGETMTLLLAVGFATIFLATLISELKVDFKKIILHKKYQDIENKESKE